MSLPAAHDATTDGVRLLSHRPSVLFKVQHLATAPCDGDIATSGIVLSGPAWLERLRDLMGLLSPGERAYLFAVRLDDAAGLPLPASTLLDRARTDWFPRFLSHGQLTPVFQPILDLHTGGVYAREALIRGRLGRTEVRGAELLDAAEAHDALFSFDPRARAAALEAGLPLLPAGEVLFVKLDPRAVLDVDASLRSVWPAVERAGADPAGVGLEIMGADRHPDLGLLEALAAAHRDLGAVISLDDLSAGAGALRAVEVLRPAVAKLSPGLSKDLDRSPARRQLAGALVELAHEHECRVVAVGIERDFELEQAQDLGADLGQGPYLGQPTGEMLPVDARVVARAVG